jgi:predicted RNA-binding Zn-ribbon protein involved in translation (DUF1610 family)
MKENLKIYRKNCPTCGNEQIYKNEISLKRSIKNNIECISCAQKKCKIGIKNPFYGKAHSDETLKKIRITLIGKSHTKETCNSMSKSRTGKKFTEEHRLNISLSKRGKANPFYGKTHSEETLKKIRVKRIEQVADRFFNGGQVYPNYNPNSIPIIEQKAKELGIADLQHAENGGEFFISELGYWVDGYSKEKNIVIEYYEPFHSKQIEKDLKRQKEIEEFLKCEFIIIKE